jgi:hypothetical protein
MGPQTILPSEWWVARLGGVKQVKAVLRTNRSKTDHNSEA